MNRVLRACATSPRVIGRRCTRAAPRAAVALATTLAATAAVAAAPAAAPESVTAPPGPAAGLADSAGLRATVFGTPPDDIAPMPRRVPLTEIDIAFPWARPIPEVLWFNRRLRVWLSAQDGPAPLAIVISGTGSDGNTSKLGVLRGALYGAGYHVLTVPSPTFPGFIVAASSTGVAGDLEQDSQDLYAALVQIRAHLPRKVRITDVDVLGYSLGGAHAGMVKSIDARVAKLGIHRAVMIEPPVSLFASVGRLDKLFAQSIGGGEQDIERLYRQLYAQVANLYRASNRGQIDESFLFAAAASVLKSDAELSAAIALSFRLSLEDMFFAADLYAGTGVVVDPRRPPRVGDSLLEMQRVLRGKPFSEYFTRVFAPYYLAHRPGSTAASLIAGNRLSIIGDALRANEDYYVQANANDLILDRRELEWLERTLGSRIVVYDHGGHLGNIGDRQQVSDMLAMLAGRFRSEPR